MQSKTTSAASTLNQFFDIAIVGGGIVGCATARQLKLTRPGLSAILVEKEDKLAAHQSGHNSGVLHAGIYYAPGSLKAKLCVQGIDLAYDYLESKHIPYKKCGKLIVALNELETSRLQSLYDRAQQNNCKGIEIVDSNKIQEIEPHCKGTKAIWSPYTGIVDFAHMTRQLAEDFKQMGGVVKLKWPVKNISQSENVENSIRLDGPTSEKEIFAKYVVTCAGLHSDRIAKLTGGSTVPKIVPFRGEYLRLKKEKHYLVKQSNIYPVPDPRFPFLGVHFTPTIEGDVLLGPNAVLAYKREGYRKTDFSLTDLVDAITFPGFLRLMTKYWFYGTGEFYRSFRTSAQVKLLQQYIPELKPDDVEVGRAGVRAQALDMNGNLIEDFVFEKGTGPLSTKVLHVRNAPSPGATSSLAIAEMIVNKCAKEFGI